MGLFDIFFKKKNTSDVAKDRLKLLLVSDRANCSPDVMEQIKNEIIQVIAKYMDIDTEALEIQITSTESEGGNGNVPALIANIPIKDIRQKELKEHLKDVKPEAKKESDKKDEKKDEKKDDTKESDKTSDKKESDKKESDKKESNKDSDKKDEKKDDKKDDDKKSSSDNKGKK
ncbi:MAG: cell division topological specificity factor MinE [Lachnospiraceae bacterium]|nr:cell division topological specificity factor MinE [Lachnospiraceae bacterium]